MRAEIIPEKIDLWLLRIDIEIDVIKKKTINRKIYYFAKPYS